MSPGSKRLRPAVREVRVLRKVHTGGLPSLSHACNGLAAIGASSRKPPITSFFSFRPHISTCTRSAPAPQRHGLQVQTRNEGHDVRRNRGEAGEREAMGSVWTLHGAEAQSLSRPQGSSWLCLSRGGAPEEEVRQDWRQAQVL